MSKCISIVFICFSVLISFGLSSQIPVDFRFLNHDKINDEVGSTFILESKMFSSHSRGVDQINFDYTLNDFTIYGEAEEYEFIKENDSTYHYMALRVSDHDLLNLGPKAISIYGDNHISKSFKSIESRYIAEVFDMTYDSLQGWWALSNYNRGLIYLKDHDILDTFHLNSFYDKIYTNPANDIYLVNSGSISHFDGQEVHQAISIPFLRDVMHSGGYNFVLAGSSILKYDSNFDNLISTWNVPFIVESLKQLHVLNQDQIYLLRKTSELNIYKLENDLNFEFLNNITTQAAIDKVLMLSDSSYVVYGQHQFELSSQTFYRHEIIDQNIEYPTVDIDLSSFTIDYELTDTIHDFINDTLIVGHFINPKIEIHNKNLFDLNHAKVFTNRVFHANSFIPFINLRFNLVQPVLSFSYKEIAGNQIVTFYEDLVNIKAELTGGNYKFKKNGAQTVYPDLITSVTGIQIGEVKLFPNPASDKIAVDNSKLESIVIFNTQGKVVFEANGFYKESIDVSSFIPGAYFILGFDFSGNPHINKFIKQ